MIEDQKKEWLSKIIWLLMMMNPFLDVITSFSNHMLGHSSYFVFGMKFLFLVFLFGLCMKKLDKRLVIYMSISSLYILVFLGLQFRMKGSGFLFLEAQSLFRTFYLPFVFSFLMILYQRGIFKVKRKNLILLLFFYLSFLVFPTLAGVSFDSYAHSKQGNIGWFYSTNEVGGILAILGPFLFLFLKNHKWWIQVVGFLCYLSGILVLGTKVPVLAFLFMVLCFLIVFFRKLLVKKDWKKIIYSAIGTVLCTLLLFFIVWQSSFYKNIRIHLKFLGIHEVQDLFTFHHIDHFIFSERLSFLKNTHELYQEVSFSEKVVGMGIGDVRVNSPRSMKMIEMDYFDIFYHYGVWGSFCFVLAFLLFYKKRKYQLDEKISMGLVLLLSFFSGHILVSPSVSVLVAIVLVPKEVEVFK